MIILFGGRRVWRLLVVTVGRIAAMAGVLRSSVLFLGATIAQLVSRMGLGHDEHGRRRHISGSYQVGGQGGCERCGQDTGWARG